MIQSAVSAMLQLCIFSWLGITAPEQNAPRPVRLHTVALLWGQFEILIVIIIKRVVDVYVR